MGLQHRISPIVSRLRGKAPLCPWWSLIQSFHPGTWRAYPPASDIKILDSADNRHLLRFADKHDFWFPATMIPKTELWNEYLVTTWDHRCNPHKYLKNGITLGAGDVVLDCGACEGFFARQALDLGVAKVLCVEPNAEMVACLEVTFQDEIRSGRVSILPYALGSLSGEANFSVSPGEAFSGRFDGSGDDRVPIITLDQLISRYEAPTMIKMDLEGSEYEALRGGFDFISERHPKLAVTTYHHPWDYPVITSFLKGAGYRKLTMSSATLRNGQIPRPVMVHAWLP